MTTLVCRLFPAVTHLSAEMMIIIYFVTLTVLSHVFAVKLRNEPTFFEAFVSFKLLSF